MIFSFLGVLSAIIFIVCDFPYLIDTIKGRITPHRVTWGVAFLLNTVGFANQWASGADNSLWLFGAGVLMTGSIFIASIKNGVGGHTKLDIASITVCLLGLGLWLTFDSPILSIYANILIAVAALTPTFVKAKKNPESETRIAWLGGTISALLATISVGELNYQLLILPATSTVLQGYMAYLLYVRPRQST